jgi:hypothetical protein
MASNGGEDASAAYPAENVNARGKSIYLFVSILLMVGKSITTDAHERSTNRPKYQEKGPQEQQKRQGT